ncbi:hypothetical protein EDB19DRAFT_1750774 [Suillus lakei]|nr:hypothetical protein EDB19DRAFT_1750774 [Suillus lakei]
MVRVTRLCWGHIPFFWMPAGSHVTCRRGGELGELIMSRAPPSLAKRYVAGSAGCDVHPPRCKANISGESWGLGPCECYD